MSFENKVAIITGSGVRIFAVRSALKPCFAVARAGHSA